MAADQDEGTPVRVPKPWGYELHWAVTGKYAAKILHVDAGHALSLQYHERKEESLLVARGLIELELDDDNGKLRARQMREGDSVHIVPGRRHRMTAIEDSDLFEVSTPELDDVVRLEDRYGRVAGTGPNP